MKRSGEKQYYAEEMRNNVDNKPECMLVRHAILGAQAC